MHVTELHIDQELQIELRETAEALLITLRGASGARDPSVFLDPLLSDAVEIALRADKELVIDFRGLRWMNSSTLPPFLRLIARAQGEPLRLRLVYDRQQHWQGVSFSVLAAFETIDRRISVSSK